MSTTSGASRSFNCDGPRCGARRGGSKRAIDVAAASVLLVLASPVLLACAIGVRISSPGPTLFKQKRVGQHGELFELLKFRSMRENDNSDTNWSGTDQDLMTGFGRFMRRTGIDELPQLWNVLRGEMSLVGPRPERPHFADRFSIEVNGYEDRHRVPVGITGWAQVHGLRGDSSIAHRATFDNNYIEQWSLWHDVVNPGANRPGAVHGRGAVTPRSTTAVGRMTHGRERSGTNGGRARRGGACHGRRPGPERGAMDRPLSRLDPRAGPPGPPGDRRRRGLDGRDCADRRRVRRTRPTRPDDREPGVFDPPLPEPRPRGRHIAVHRSG